MSTLQLDSPIARGRTAEVYAWETGQVIKLFYDWVPPAWLDHEIAIGRVIATKDLPTPKFLGVETIQDRTGILYERVPGESMLALLAKRPWSIPRLARQLAEVQTAIHRQSGSGLDQVRGRLRRTIERVENLPADLRDAALQALNLLPEGETLLHMDLHPDQVMISPTGPVVIDWSNAMQGDPLADVARTTLMLTIGEPLDASPAMLLLARFGRGLLFNTYIRRYFQLNPGARMDQVNAWLVPVAASRLPENLPGEPEKLKRLIRRLSKI